MHTIHYRVSPADPAAHLFHVSCLITQPDVNGQRVIMPAWIPGSYLIRDFAKNIVHIRASSAGKPVAITPLDKDSWQCSVCTSPLLIEYQVYAGDSSVRGAKLDTSKGFFNGTSLFVRVPGREHEACGMTLLAPESEGYAEWKVATTLTAVDVDDRGYGEYAAGNYDDLVDHPVALGSFELGRFKADDVPHEMAFFGYQRADIERVCSDLKHVCEHHMRFFKDAAPFQRYLFIVMVAGDGYGGLEHRDSCVLICSRDHLPYVGKPTMDEQYREFLGLCSHEYFHSWNVKRIKPAAFTPVDYQKENYTTLLWVFEGITSYYDDLALLRSGRIDAKSYLELLGQTMTRVLRNKGRLRQTVAESSFYAWTKFYKPDENTANAVVSYYAKGALIALGLDLTLRASTNNRYSLDDVMVELWSRHGKTESGVGEDGFEALAIEFGGEALKNYFDRSVRSVDELPLQEWLAGYGISVYLRASESSGDKGGKPSAKLPAAEMGVTLKEEAGWVKVISVGEGSVAQKAGIWATDVIVACNGLKASIKRIALELSHARPGDTFVLHVFRGDELLIFNPILQSPEPTTCYLEIDKDADAERVAAREAWLRTGSGSGVT